MGRQELDEAAMRRLGAQMVEASEQLVAVYTREAQSIKELNGWLRANPTAGPCDEVSAWLAGEGPYLLLAQGKGGGPARCLTAKNLEEVTGQGLASMGTPANGLRKSLCRVLSGRGDVVQAIGKAWTDLGGMSIASQLAKLK